MKQKQCRLCDKEAVGSYAYNDDMTGKNWRFCQEHKKLLSVLFYIYMKK